MAILMTAVMPVWKQDAQREKEAELVFRGQQYVHAIQLYQRTVGPGAYPPSFDFMVQQKFLRKRYKDPITNSDFLPLPGAAQANVPGAPAGGAAGSTTAISTSTSTGTNGGSTTGVAIPLTPTADGSAPGGVAGVMSKSTDKSIRIFNGATHYNEWLFRALAQPQNGRGAAGGPAGNGQRGAPPNGQNPAGGFGGVGPGGARGTPRGGPQRFGPNGPIGPPGGPANGPPPNGGRGFQILPPPGRGTPPGR
jgi:type II secretory pathway pseudopilin PulG